MALHKKTGSTLLTRFQGAEGVEPVPRLIGGVLSTCRLGFFSNHTNTWQPTQ
jgi:hypothetical protein